MKQAIFGAMFLIACNSDGRDENDASPVTNVLSASAGSTFGTTDASTTQDEAATDGVLDVAAGVDTPAMPMRCEKMDIVFVVDNSASMFDEQQNLLTSFPGFFTSIQSLLGDDDVRIMVIDTDVGLWPGGCYESIYNSFDCGLWCPANCPDGCNCECNAEVCAPFVPMPCEAQLGAGRVASASGIDCGLGGATFFSPDDADPMAAFQCLAQVGIEGEPTERPIMALQRALTEQNAAGGCNEGFLRNDALLIVTIITDEDDVRASLGDPAQWVDDLVATKAGNANSAVVIGLLSDSDVPGGVCSEFDPTDNSGASAAPRLREFVESFPFGFWGSVCEPNFSPIFNEAVAAIDTACDDFVPAG